MKSSYYSKCIIRVNVSVLTYVSILITISNQATETSCNADCENFTVEYQTVMKRLTELEKKNSAVQEENRALKRTITDLENTHETTIKRLKHELFLAINAVVKLDSLMQETDDEVRRILSQYFTPDQITAMVDNLSLIHI